MDVDAKGATALDDVDRRLLALLAEDARRSYAELAERVGLSPPSVHARVRKLERRGVIRRYTIETDPEQLGHRVAALIAVQQQPGYHWERLEAAFREMPAVEAAYSVTGEDTYVLLVRVASPADLEDLLRNINSLEGVARTRTSLILSTTFERRRI
ncbi:MAG TPA: Lrp/AsnC family transcriptional regulator [Candidatus Dormibacteraeota bacterium]|jgi:Lrp/AsnC family leucine-responsive transcriptional regulator|nr:Lrp/AsnC family transcriptional regulator [Candidatus Dormibacteraeota bacterium]